MNRSRLRAPALCAFLLAALAGQAAPPPQQSSAPAPPTPAPAPGSSPAQNYFSDVVLLDQQGESRRFYSDLLKGKVVLITSFFSTCEGVCPLMNHKLKEIQDALGDKVGKEVYILSLSVDPERDTPARLKEYAQTLGAKPGWYFLTGKKQNVDWALYKVGMYVEAKEDHSTLLIVGNEPKGLWKKILIYAPTDQLLKVVEDALNDK